MLACALLTLGCSDVRAQTPAAALENWVQVEVIVFRHLDTSGVADEQFPAQPALGYPNAIRFLREPGQPDAAMPPALPTTPAVMTADPAAQQAPVVSVALPEPFVQLPGAERMLGETAARIANSRNYRLLSHLAWRQPMPARNAPDSLLVTGGVQAGDHWELEGSVSLSRTRFVHLETRLWLNDFADTAMTGAEATLELPPVPVAPPAETGFAIPVDSVPESFAAADPSPADSETPQQGLEATLPTRVLRSVLLAENRRLRSGELHYIDHPMLGVLIKLQDYSPQQP